MPAKSSVQLHEVIEDWVSRARRIARAIGANAAQHDADESFVAPSYAMLRESGFLSALVPSELGGDGAGFGEMCSAIRALGEACGSTALAFSMHAHLVATAAWRWRHQNAPTDGLLKRVAAEGLVLVSSGGSDWLTGSGTAVKVEGGFAVSGRKIFSSGSPAGDLLMTSAVYDDPAAGATVLHFALPLKAKGVTILDTWHTLGMRGTGSHDVELKDVFIADGAVSGRRPQGKWHPLFHTISMIAFPLIYSAYVGIADGARATALTMAAKKAGEPQVPLLAGAMENAFASAEMALERMIATAETAKPLPY